MYTQIILLLFGLHHIAAHALKESTENPCFPEYKEPPRRFTNGHGFQYLYRRRPLEIVPLRPTKVQDKADVTVPTTTETIPDTSNVTTPVVSTSEPTTDKVTATVVRRNNMFNSMKEKYQSNKKKNSPSDSKSLDSRSVRLLVSASNTSEDNRQKREINNKVIPEAPTLPELDMHSFSDYVQTMLASRLDFETRNKTLTLEQNSDSSQDDSGKLFDDTENYKKPRTYGMKLNNGQGYSWNLVTDHQNKNTYDENQYTSEPIQELTKPPTVNIPLEKTEQENLLDIDKETKPTSSIEEKINNTQKLEILEKNNDLTTIKNEVGKNDDANHSNSNDNIKEKLKDMFANISGMLRSTNESKPRTYGMSLRGYTANIWNDIASAPDFNIQATTAMPAIESNTENNTSTISDNIIEPTNDKSIGQNNTDLAEDSGDDKEINYDNKSLIDQIQISHLTTTEPKITSTTLVPNPKIKRHSKERTVNLKENTDLREKMKKSFNQILEKIPPFEPITTKPNATADLNSFEEKNNKVPKTYGMNLTGNHGYIWNELIKPGFRYNVGEMETSNTTDLIYTESTTNPTTEENKTENFSKPTAISSTESQTTSKVTTSSEKDVKTTLAPVTTEITTELKPQTTEHPQTTEQQPETTETSIIPTATTEQNESDTNENTNPEGDKNPLQISLDELLKKDEFWNWLSKWTTIYMEVLNENIEKLVKDEVTKQLKIYMANNGTETNKDRDREENNKEDKENDKNPSEVDSSKTEDSANNTIYDANKDDQNKDNNRTNAEIKESSENVKKNMNKLNQNVNQTSLNVKANSIYGGAVGNDHVTNIFIFNSNDQANKTIQSILDGIYSKKPVNTTSDEVKNEDKNSDKTNSTVSSEEKDNTDEIENATTSSNQTEELPEKDKINDENDETAQVTSTTRSTINTEDTKDSKTESTIGENSTESSKDDTTKVASSSEITSVATTLTISDDVTDMDSSTPSSTIAASVRCCNTTDETTTLSSNVKEVSTEEYDCETKDSRGSGILEINIGAKNTDSKNNVRKCIRDQKEKAKPGILATLGVNIKNPLKNLLNI